MEGRVRPLLKEGAIRQRQLERVGDPFGEDSSRDARQSHTAPLGLPATGAEDIYSKLGVIKKNGVLTNFPITADS